MAGNLDMAKQYHEGYKNQDKVFEKGFDSEQHVIRGANLIEENNWSLTGINKNEWSPTDEIKLKDVFVLLQNWTRIGEKSVKVTFTLNIGGKDFSFKLEHTYNYDTRQYHQITVYDTENYRWSYNDLFSIFNKWENYSLIASLMLQSAKELVDAQTSWEDKYKSLADKYQIRTKSISVGDAMRMLMILGQVAEAARPKDEYYEIVTQMMSMKTAIENADDTERGWQIFEKTLKKKIFQSLYRNLIENNGIKEAKTTKKQAIEAWNQIFLHRTYRTGRIPGADKLFRLVLEMVKNNKIEFNQAFHYFFVLSLSGGTSLAREHLIRPRFCSDDLDDIKYYVNKTYLDDYSEKRKSALFGVVYFFITQYKECDRSLYLTFLKIGFIHIANADEEKIATLHYPQDYKFSFDLLFELLLTNY